MGTGPGQLEHGDLVQDLCAAILASPPLLEELGGELLAGGLGYALSDHRKLAPAGGGTSSFHFP